MRQKNKIGFLTGILLFSSISIAFASLAVLSPPPERFIRSPHLWDNAPTPILEPALEQPRTETEKATGPKYFIDYKAWRHIQASA